jgi:putative FmdB family regulatory protein
MPVYSFACKCGETISVSRSIHDEIEPQICKCGKEMSKVFAAPPTIFKGKGFYRTDRNG